MFERGAYIASSCTMVGPKEDAGAFGGLFDIVLSDDRCGEKSYEKAESRMHRTAIEGALARAGLTDDGVDLMLAGDLLNEISASNLAMRHFKTPFLGLYNACSTFTEAVLLAATLIDSGQIERACCSTSSHFASAERQYRYPLELGNQRTPTSQWTVTGAGAVVLSDEPVQEDEGAYEGFLERVSSLPPRGFAAKIAAKKGKMPVKVCRQGHEAPFDAVVTGGTLGRVVDYGLLDESNMGAAMAPAAADTLLRHFEDTGLSPCDYDAICTGDLGRFGSEALHAVLSSEGVDIGAKHLDLGAEYYLPEQKTFQGGSGAGCVNTAFCAFVLPKLRSGEWRRVLVLATGALLSKDTPLQKESIPGISHAFVAESAEKRESTLENAQKYYTIGQNRE